MKNENILLKKEKVMMMQEKNRIQMFLQNMQNAVNTFNARSPLSNAATVITNSTAVPPLQNFNRNPPGRYKVFVIVNELKFGYCCIFFQFSVLFIFNLWIYSFPIFVSYVY